jgi:hypothetical protein
LKTGRLGDLWSTYFGKPFRGRQAEPFVMLHRAGQELVP